MGRALFHGRLTVRQITHPAAWTGQLRWSQMQPLLLFRLSMQVRRYFPTCPRMWRTLWMALSAGAGVATSGTAGGYIVVWTRRTDPHPYRAELIAASRLVSRGTGPAATAASRLVGIADGRRYVAAR